MDRSIFVNGDKTAIDDSDDDDAWTANGNAFLIVNVSICGSMTFSVTFSVISDETLSMTLRV